MVRIVPLLYMTTILIRHSEAVMSCYLNYYYDVLSDRIFKLNDNIVGEIK